MIQQISPFFPSVPQMGLLLDLSPDGGMNDEGNDEDLEAELLNLVGGGGAGGRSQGKKGDGRGERLISYLDLIRRHLTSFCLIHMLVRTC